LRANPGKPGVGWLARWGSAIAFAPPVPLVSFQHVRVPIVGGEADDPTRAEGVGETCLQHGEMANRRNRPSVRPILRSPR
jgi:hypothetical protein